VQHDPPLSCICTRPVDYVHHGTLSKDKTKGEINREYLQRGIPGNRKKVLLDSPYTMISEKTNLHIYVYFRIISLYQVDGQI